MTIIACHFLSAHLSYYHSPISELCACWYPGTLTDQVTEFVCVRAFTRLGTRPLCAKHMNFSNSRSSGVLQQIGWPFMADTCVFNLGQIDKTLLQKWIKFFFIFLTFVFMPYILVTNVYYYTNLCTNKSSKINIKITVIILILILHLLTYLPTYLLHGAESFLRS